MSKILTTEDADQTVTDVCWHLEHESWHDEAASVRALRESNEALRDLLRRVVSQQCVKVYEEDSSEGEIVPVIDAIEDTLRAEVDAALGVGR